MDQEVSFITCAGWADGDNITDAGALGSAELGGNRELKRFHSADTQGPRGVGLCSLVESSAQCSSVSSGVSRSNSLHIHSHTHTSLLSPRRKKKMSPPCISVDPPDVTEPQSGLYANMGAPGGMGLGGLGMPPPLPNRDTCLRRRAPSSDSKDSFDLGVGDSAAQDSGSSNPAPITTPTLLTLSSFSFDKSSSDR